MIDLRNVTYRYPSGPMILNEVSLHIDAGEFVLVTGASGSGKSTLLRCLNGLVPHFSGGRIGGQVRVRGLDGEPLDPVAVGPSVMSGVVGFVFQDPEAQFVVDRVEDEIAFALEQQAVPFFQMRGRVEECLHLLGLDALRARRVESLSGGERQRVAIAAALALRPRVLVLDEPTSQLDPASAADVLDALLRLNQEMGLTIVLAEHRLERVIRYVNRMIHLRGEGLPILTGTPREVLPQIELVPPLIALGRALGWDPLPLTVAEARTRNVPIAPPSPPIRPADAHPGPILAARDIHHAYDDTPILRGASLEVRPGELVALMGRNGSGKTTLLRSIVGLLCPDRGTVALDGEWVIGRDPADLCRSIGYLPQNPDDLLFADTVLKELLVTLHNLGLLDAPPLNPAALLERLGLGAYAERYPRDLSVGQRQRVALGAITVARPRLLLLDEPTRGMDYPAKRELVRLLDAWRAEGTGVLLVTHDIELVAHAADRVALLEDGVIALDGPPAEVLCARPHLTPQIAQLYPGTGWLTEEEALEGLR